MIRDDDRLRADVEEAVDMIRAAQHPDGYINSYYTVHGIAQRWTNLRDMHEMYCLGHLIEACVAYEALTHSGRLLDPVMKVVRHVDSLFGPEKGKKRGYPGHQEIEIGLLRLYELTGEPILLKLAKYFSLERGRKDENGEIFYDHEARARGVDPYTDTRSCYEHPRDYAYQQAHEPLLNQSEIKGHAVRAMYFTTAATDYVRFTGDQQVQTAVDRLSRDTIDTKLYVTGGLGAIRQWEGFGPQYFLADTEEGNGCYAETCASFALVIWCSRLLRLSLKSEYADVMEVTLYNGFLGAVSLDGQSFYYQNPMRTYTGRPKERSSWFDVACCPPNIAKLLGLLGSLIYSFKEDTVAIHLWIESQFAVPNTDVVISQKTDMPWSGEVEIAIQGSKPVNLALRIPGWTAGRYDCSVKDGELRDGYLYFSSLKDTTISLRFPLQARKVYANPKTNKDEICIMRGPLVYCIEDVDNNDVDVDNIALVDDRPIREGPAVKIASVDNVIPITAPGKELVNTPWSSLYGSEPWKYGDETKELTFVPFFLRMNRGGRGGMRVWVKRL